MSFKELRYAARSLSRSPIFTITAIVTIALGIGASTAIFSVADAVLLRPLPYKNPDKLVLAWQDMRVRNVHDWKFSNTDYYDLRNGANAFQSLAAVVTGRGAVAAADGTPEPIRNGGATPNFFSQMGAHVVIGRDFNEADARPQPVPVPGAPPAAALPTPAILSYEYWQRHYGGSRAVLGQAMAGAGSAVIAGVLEPGFELLLPPHANLERRPDVWYPLRITTKRTGIPPAS
jgi:putative ABC transport system permease protein